MRFVRLLWITTRPGRAWVGSVTNKHNPSTESGLGACISSRITTVIHVKNDHQINCNCFNEPFAVSPYRSLYWDMHGLIFETSIWLLAGSTRFVNQPLSSSSRRIDNQRNWRQPINAETTEADSVVIQTEVSRDLALNVNFNEHRMPDSWALYQHRKDQKQFAKVDPIASLTIPGHGCEHPLHSNINHPNG